MMDRRRFLQGAGALLALPWMERFAMASDWRAPTGRLLYVYLPNGVHVPDWIPAASSDKKLKPAGRHGRLPKRLPHSLEALLPLRDRFSILTGLTNDKGRPHGDGPGDHARAGATFLTGVQPLKENGAVSVGISADQIAAQAIGTQTRLKSLQLGCEAAGNAGQCDSGYACAYSDNISWQDATTPASKDVRPRQLFDRLFRAGATDPAQRVNDLKRHGSILDAVQADAKSLRRDLNPSDRGKLEEYFTGIRELERRLARSEEEVIAEVPDEARPGNLPKNFTEHVRLLIDMLVLAFQTDTTRVASLMFGNEGSNRRFLEIGVRVGHHTITHHKGEQKLIEEVKAINRLHSQQIAYLIKALEEAEFEGRTLLESTMTIIGSGISDGNRHDHHDLPILTTGGTALGWKHGKLREYPKETPLGNLHLEALDRLGVKKASLGDATGLLPGLHQ
ncbi:MAG: DUF1552 domain-containing protein [Planctomycetota bacterium]